MPEALSTAAGAIAGLLVPVVLLMFVALRFRKHLVYPHQLLSPRPASAPSTALLRAFRLHNDTAIDAACALIIGLAIAAFPPAAARRGDAVVIDASASMVAGIRGDRPLDEAARIIVSDEAFDGARLFTLGWDPAAREHALRDTGKIIQAAMNPIGLAAELESAEAFMSADYRLVGTLGARGFRKITLLSDNASIESRDVTIRPLRTRPARYCYPVSSAWDEAAGRSVVRFVSAGGAGPKALWRLSPDGRMHRPRPEEYTIATDDAGFELSFREAGLWALEWDGRYTPFQAPSALPPLSAEGSFAQAIVGSLRMPGDPVDSGRRGLVVRDGGGAGKRGFLSVGRARSDSFVIPPGLTLGAVVASGFDKSLDLALGPASFASAETATVFYLARASTAAARMDPQRRVSKPVRVGEGFVYPDADVKKVLVSIPPVDEYAPPGDRIPVSAGKPRTPRLPVAVALALLYILKLAVAYTAGKQNKPKPVVG